MGDGAGAESLGLAGYVRLIGLGWAPGDVETLGSDAQGRRGFDQVSLLLIRAISIPKMSAQNDRPDFSSAGMVDALMELAVAWRCPQEVSVASLSCHVGASS
ncbi:hypothetical protein NDU88_006639 [Pleurodeles waltl]|uniref:Uncharacterized protein n=1 Tax=Pleurodeles waltl TaxID=8319 RepID=A0AAV7TXN1_PLEWA|nr:hypothetical protein NDU88_006639 [Pleurodeles waltl]